MEEVGAECDCSVAGRNGYLGDQNGCHLLYISNRTRGETTVDLPGNAGSLDSKHQCKKGEVVQTGKHSIQSSLQRYDSHSGRRKGQIKDANSRQKEEQQREEYGARRS